MSRLLPGLLLLAACTATVATGAVAQTPSSTAIRC